MSLDLNEISVIHWCSENEKHRCGYCKQENSSTSQGMWAEQLTVEDYQHLIDRGWRRSGKYCYKPAMKETCCPLYTIRCDALKYKPSKSQKKIVKKLNRFLKDGILAKENPTNNTNETVEDSNIFIKDRPASNFNYKQLKSTKITNCDIIEDSATDQDMPVIVHPIHNTVNSQSGSGTNNMDGEGSSNSKIDSKDKATKKGIGADPNKPPCKKAKLLRLEKKQQKVHLSGQTKEKTVRNEEKNIEDLLNEINDSDKHKLKIVLVPTSEPGREWDRTKENEFEIYKKYQIVVHNDPPEKCSMSSFIRFLVSSPLKIKLERMSEKHESCRASWKLYVKYQMFVHNDTERDCNMDNFLEFLVHTPLKPVTVSKEGNIGLGSYHQQYWLDDKLIAVGVIDILPRCVSSVYFFYDPDYRSLTLGTYGSLREIQFTKSLYNLIPSIQHYYMGFYIHSCPKMRYKGKLVPSDLLCPETYDWIPIEKCLPKLEASKYSKLNEDEAGFDRNASTIQDINEIKILVGHSFSTYKYYKYRNSQAELFKRIGDLLGKQCVRNFLIIKPEF